MLRFLVALLLLLAGLAPMQPANAQVKHCLMADGTRLYTDRKCADLGASEYRAPPPPPAGSAYSRQTTCARNVQDLAYALDEAIRSGDANRIAGLYDWAGMRSATARGVMDRLQVIASRALVDVRSMRAGDTADADPYAAEPAGPVIGLRVEQVLADGYTPAHARFGLRRRMGCWWVRM